MFIRAVRCYVFLLCIFILATLSHHLCFLLSFSSTSWCSLFIFLSVANLHHLTVSNFLFFPPLLYSLAVTVVFFFFIFLNTSLLSPSDAFLSSPRRSLSPLLCLAYFRHRPPLSCFLLCVCCLFRLTLFSSKGMNPYTCQSAVEDTVHLLLPQAT